MGTEGKANGETRSEETFVLEFDRERVPNGSLAINPLAPPDPLPLLTERGVTGTVGVENSLDPNARRLGVRPFEFEMELLVRCCPSLGVDREYARLSFEVEG